MELIFKVGDNMSDTSTNKKKTSTKKRSVSDFKTTEAQENYLANLAYKLAEKKLKDGTASSQIITTLIGLASEKARLENEKLKSDLAVAEARIENLKRQTNGEDLLKEAVKMFRKYSGSSEEDDEEEDDEEEL